MFLGTVLNEGFFLFCEDCLVDAFWTKESLIIAGLFTAGLLSKLEIIGLVCRAGRGGGILTAAAAAAFSHCLHHHTLWYSESIRLEIPILYFYETLGFLKCC